MSLLTISSLYVDFPTDDGLVRAVNGVDLSIAEDEVLGLIGESGCGKSVLGLSIIRLLQEDVIFKGDILYRGENLYLIEKEDMRKLRGKEIGMIPQNPGSSLNPVLTVGSQIAEPLMLHKHVKGSLAVKMAEKLLERVRIGDPQKRVKDYPHQYSGGMKERAVIAMGISSEPRFLIADEPTKGLDVTVKRNIVKLLKEISEKKTMLIITHDLGVAEEVCDRIAVMYAGELVEVSPAALMFEKQLHPYTGGFFNSLPSRGLKPIKGSSPSLIDPPQGCRFHPRCNYCSDRCRTEHPPMIEKNGRLVRCFLYA
ncbi:ABC transporter ATP-binding protein [Methanosarcina mazei]|uniref:Nickel import system ATP-binding protein NikD n=1 Tax=Methanosarcina mazei TaxID=2209 RepID=A0A0F8QLQ3_METMZ|nr:ABC transporter ATP-binding protein [Methanosarcina mazei]KKH34445.1 peptide ABC transporter ATP-binding protein [Methanosarcina mazei]KKH43277.1 peptide ABC transporter ATP-binding protein [Methanosarcina mazei]KKH43531.1 peptide ABC transporter ATP-binding protein [Methanosarcina mazei]